MREALVHTANKRIVQSVCVFDFFFWLAMPWTLWLRRARPWWTVCGVAVWIIVRCCGSLTTYPSLWQLTVTTLPHAHDQIQERFSILFGDCTSRSDSCNSITSVSVVVVLQRLLNAVPWQWLWTIVEDIMAVCLLLSVYRLVYYITTYTTQEWKDYIQQAVYPYAVAYLPSVRNAVKGHMVQFRQDTLKMLGKDANRKVLTKLPVRGRPQQEILQELRQSAATENQKWMMGKISGTVYYDKGTISTATNASKGTHTTTTCTEDDVSLHHDDQPMSQNDFMNAVYSIYSSANPLHPGVWPKVNQCEAELTAMTGNLLHLNPAYGCVTSGGTESLLLAVRAHLKYYGQFVRFPEIILGSTAHAAFYKACDMYQIRPVIIPCHGKPLSAAAVRRYITSNTILIVASAPCYPQGVVDDISDLSQLALHYKIGLHVDACLGGFVLAFVNDDAPVFDFRNPGVTSMSIDTHKYGYAAKGSSVVLYRTSKLRHAQYFSYAKWSGGLYVTPTLAGSRPGALSVCAWASMLSLGQEGYCERVQSIVTAVRVMAKGISTIPGLTLLTPEGHQFMVVCFGSEALDIYHIKDVMSGSGWSLNDLQYPASIHFCVTLSVAPKANEFLRDLQLAVETVRKESRYKNNNKSHGTAAIYGTASSAPSGPVEHLLREFTDMTLTP